MPTPAPAAPQPSYHRLFHPESGFYVRLTWRWDDNGKPVVTPTLTRRQYASRFPRWSAAAECFSRYLSGQPLEIVRCDA